jgi:hypothetical protein
MAASSTKRRRRRSSEPNLNAKVTGILLLVVSTLYLYSLWQTQSFLDSLEERSRFRIPALLLHKHAAIEAASRGNLISIQTDAARLASEKASQALQNKPSMQKIIPNQQPAPREPSVEDKYIVFIPIPGGQGTGNIVAGLLAAHLLALEFNRIVCVSPLYQKFLDAFEPANPVVIEKCPLLLGSLPNRTSDNFLNLINYAHAPDECLFKETLASHVPVLYLRANTYPRWPVIPDNFFFTNYRAKPELLKALPYSESPTTVVHLRQSDGKQDFRSGLDDDSLKALGKMLPRDTYLVTNRVEWYDKFEKEYGWSHPEWNEVFHSAFQRSWGVRGLKEQRESNIVQTFDRETQNLQMWCDWYTILTAQFVYHTHSDFSISAIHWQNLDSRTILGLNATTGELELEEESWRITGETERLVDRTLGGQGTSDLRLCKGKDRRRQESLRQRKQK